VRIEFNGFGRFPHFLKKEVIKEVLGEVKKRFGEVKRLTTLLLYWLEV